MGRGGIPFELSQKCQVLVSISLALLDDKQNKTKHILLNNHLFIHLTSYPESCYQILHFKTIMLLIFKRIPWKGKGKIHGNSISASI